MKSIKLKAIASYWRAVENFVKLHGFRHICQMQAISQFQLYSLVKLNLLTSFSFIFIHETEAVIPKQNFTKLDSL